MSSNDALFIPKKIRVGYQKRRDTYTGKLGYIIYYDKTNKIRKEKSWESWRDKNIDAQEFENIPTSGFVLNKKVGDEKYGWNPRQAWTRIYDPRGFEFEIDINNLLFILENCSSEPGKALGGEFVYSYNRDKLVLLPVCSKEYQSSQEFSDLKEKKISKIVPGTEYYSKGEKCWYFYVGEVVQYVNSYYSERHKGYKINLYYNVTKNRFETHKKLPFVAQRESSLNAGEQMQNALDTVDSLHPFIDFQIVDREEAQKIDSDFDLYHRRSDSHAVLVEDIAYYYDYWYYYIISKNESGINIDRRSYHGFDNCNIEKNQKLVILTRSNGKKEFI